jgi:nitrite reductase/ring-hydroxylating ferredoxin subunit
LADEQNQTTALSGDEKWMPVCGLSRLISQTIVCARVTGIDLVLIWNEGRAVACERMCPHEQADLSLGHLAAGRLCCPRHAASFDLRNGQISYGWPSRPLRIYPVRVVDDQVWIDAVAMRSTAS